MGYIFKKTAEGPQVTRPDGANIRVNPESDIYNYPNIIVIVPTDSPNIELRLQDIESIDGVSGFKTLEEAYNALRGVFHTDTSGDAESNGMAKGVDPEGNAQNIKVSGDAFFSDEPLGANKKVSTGWLNITNFDSLNFIFYSDVPGKYLLEYSHDQENVVVPPIEVNYDEPGIRRKGVVDPDAAYVRITFTNGGTAQRIFAMIVRFKSGLSQPSLEILGAQGAASRLAQWCKSVLHVIDDNGIYGDIHRVGNSLKVHVDNPASGAVSISNDSQHPVPVNLINESIKAVIDALPAIVLKTGQTIGVTSLPDVKIAANQIIKATIDALPAIALAANQSVNIGTMSDVGLKAGSEIKVNSVPPVEFKANQTVNIGTMPAVTFAVDQIVKAVVTSLPAITFAPGQSVAINNADTAPVPVNIKNTDYAKDGTDITGSAMPAGGGGIRGWLSAIFKRLVDGLTVTFAPYPLKKNYQPAGAGGNFAIVKPAPGTIGTIVISNTGSAAINMFLYDMATLPGSGNTPVMIISISGNTTVPIRFEGGVSFDNGIGIGFGGIGTLANIVSLLLTSINGGSINVNIVYK